MSTSARINFLEDGSSKHGSIETTLASVYNHSDGHPQTHIIFLRTFFEAVKSVTEDTRVNDPIYLSGKFVTFLASMYARDGRHPLSALSYGVIDSYIDMDADFTYDLKFVLDGYEAVSEFPLVRVTSAYQAGNLIDMGMGLEAHYKYGKSVKDGWHKLDAVKPDVELLNKVLGDYPRIR